MQSRWWRALAFLPGLLALCLILWLAFDLRVALAAASLGLAWELIRHLRQLERLNRWLEQPDTELPDLPGPWGETFYRLRKYAAAQQHARASGERELDWMLQAARLLPDGVVLLDEQQRIVWLNAAAQQHLGLSEVRDRGQFVTYLLRNSAFTGWLGGPADATLTLELADGRTLTLQQIELPHGRRMLLSHDITELARVDAMRRDFVANVSHELRTPITVIAGFLETFADMEQPDAQQLKAHLQLLLQQSERIRRLLDDLLMLARLESEAESPQEEVDVPMLMRGLYAEAQTLSQGQHELRLELDSPSRLRGNTKEIHSAFSNLVSNAVRYTPAGGHITLRWRDNASGGAEFSVTDTGEGIEAHHIPRLTERFYRVDRGRSRATGGTGLGLAIVKHVLQRHQGHLRIESTVGKGSTFTAVFPAERVIPAVRAAPPQPVQAVA
ncbi:MAG: phosphate regulon sensor histidine kinase PhoR [Thiobacillaceae bacterium]|nr:phosphate regulon sensor histidine kinase PhoR [Thiobacillaceae bacterium]MCX7672330.1 phosphate regulon sensor histidine kinase PhoR [Thiobacillaceae bacterium]MDW8323944.1 phosphate regulon sensor histidine kinase PhoR [Burkholderiales bacterium]